MLDLKTIFGMREQTLPQEGFLGFLLENWLILAAAIMVLGFVIDQVLYIVRYRPQDSIRRAVRGIKRFALHVMGQEIPEELEEDLYEPQPILEEKVEPEIEEESIYDGDAPVIRRGGAIYAPQPYDEPEKVPVMQHADADADAPKVVRAADDRPVVVRRAEPYTKK